MTMLEHLEWLFSVDVLGSTLAERQEVLNDAGEVLAELLEG